MDQLSKNRPEYVTGVTYIDEDKKKIAQANAEINEKGDFLEDRIKSRHQGDFPILGPKDLEYMDVAPNQISSISASPFI